VLPEPLVAVLAGPPPAVLHEPLVAVLPRPPPAVLPEALVAVLAGPPPAVLQVAARPHQRVHLLLLPQQGSGHAVPQYHPQHLRRSQHRQHGWLLSLLLHPTQQSGQAHRTMMLLLLQGR